MKWDKVKEAKQIIRDNYYLTLSTSNGKSWASPVYYSYDKNYTFYFVSPKNSLHVKYLRKNSKVAFAIFDSHQKPRTGVGLQIEGICSEVNRNKLAHAISIHTTREFRQTGIKSEHKPEDFLWKKLYRVFQIIPKKIFINSKFSKIDYRILIKLSK